MPFDSDDLKFFDDVLDSCRCFENAIVDSLKYEFICIGDGEIAYKTKENKNLTSVLFVPIGTYDSKLESFRWSADREFIVDILIDNIGSEGMRERDKEFGLFEPVVDISYKYRNVIPYLIAAAFCPFELIRETTSDGDYLYFLANIRLGRGGFELNKFMAKMKK